MDLNDGKDNKNEIIQPKIEVSLELLINLRNLIEITNERITWKTNELLPVGIMIQQLDEIIKNTKENIENKDL